MINRSAISTPRALLMHCKEKWERPPNFLIVDFYNQGPAPGSVFEAAAQANGVTYDRRCCGTNARSAAATSTSPYSKYLGLFIAVAVVLLV